MEEQRKRQSGKYCGRCSARPGSQWELMEINRTAGGRAAALGSPIAEPGVLTVPVCTRALLGPDTALLAPFFNSMLMSACF
jgi:hypothetical protein